MNTQAKQVVAFFAAAGITAGILTWLSVAPRAPMPVGEQGIPSRPEHLEMSSVSRSLAEMLPSIYGVPTGDVVVVPNGTGWKAVVFGITDGDRRKMITKNTADFSKSNPDVGAIEVVFDSPPQ